jgi:hypothetical protein
MSDLLISNNLESDTTITDKKVERFRELMKEKNNRRLARYALSKSQGILRSYASLPYNYKYKNEIINEKNVLTDELTEKYEKLLNGNSEDKAVANSIDDILSPNTSKWGYFLGTWISIAAIIMIVVMLLVMMFYVKPNNNNSIIIGLLSGAALAPLISKICCDAAAILAWIKTS